VTRISEGGLADADMEISAPKSEIMFCRPRVNTGAITAEAYDADALQALYVSLAFTCQFCQRGFDTRTGCRIHEGRHCKVGRVELTEQVFELDKVLDVRGSPDRRFYCVKWKGWDVADATWMHSRRLEQAQGLVDEYWGSGVAPDPAAVITVPGELRCPDCNKMDWKRE
jgi:hypothetical protein